MIVKLVLFTLLMMFGTVWFTIGLADNDGWLLSLAAGCWIIALGILLTP